MIVVGVHEAKTKFSDLRRRVEAGEEVTIRRRRTVIARLVPAGPTGTRSLGMDAGRLMVPNDVGAPLPEEPPTYVPSRIRATGVTPIATADPVLSAYEVRTIGPGG